MFSAEAHVGRGGGGVCIICSVCQVVIVACCFIPLFSIPESEVLGKHCKLAACLPRSLVLGRARERIFLLSSSTNGPLRQGVWAATTTMQLVRRMEWRPPLLYAYPLGHRVLDNLKNH